MSDHRIDVYFQHVQPIFPILHRARFFSSLLLPASPTSPTNILLRSIVVCASFYSHTDSRLAVPSPAKFTEFQAYAESSPYPSDFVYHQKIIDYALDNPSLKATQALVILALSYVGSGYTSRLWAVTSILARLATSMSLHLVDETKDSKTSSFKSLCLLPRTSNESEMEERRRLFWGIFLIDRYVASSTGWTPILSEKDIQVRLPSLESLYQKTTIERRRDLRANEEFDSWALYVESIGIQGRIIEYLRIKWGVQDHQIREKHGLSLLRKVESWWNELPEKIRNLDLSGQVGGNIILLHLTYYRYLFH
jgi:hypothetical protein